MQNQPTPVSSGTDKAVGAQSSQGAADRRAENASLFHGSKGILQIISRRGSQTLQGTRCMLPLTPRRHGLGMHTQVTK